MPPERVTEELAPARLTLWDIEAAWLELIQARQEAEELPAERPVCLTCGGRGTIPAHAHDALPLRLLNPEKETEVALCSICEGSGRSKSEREQALAACDQAIAEYVHRETMKVDGIRAVCRALKSAVAEAKQERDYQAKRMQSAEALLDRIKSCAQTAMEAAGKKRIDGRTGYLLVKKNGGVEPLDVYDAAMLPEECIRMVGSIPLPMWRGLLKRAGMDGVIGADLRKEPDNVAIRAALAEDCPPCHGGGNMTTAEGEAVTCKCCGGSGRNAVPGARLLERGSHLEIK